jgi:16S rRNA processing protein RimM
MKELDKWIEAGSIVRPHGLAGEVVVEVKNDLADLVSDTSVLRATDGEGHERLLTVESVRGDARRPIFRFSACDTRDQAELLRSWVLWVSREQLGELEEDRWLVQDILGLDVVTDDGEYLGKLTEVMPQPANDVFVVEADGEEILLPFIKEVVLDVDVSAGRVTVHLMEGMRRGTK